MSAYLQEKKNKILVLANHDVGLYRFRRELLQALLDKGNEVVIALPRGEMVACMVKAGCRFIETPIDRRGTDPIKDLILFHPYKKLLTKEKPDLVITYTIKPNIYGALACRMMHIPYAVNITGTGTAFHRSGFLKKLVTGLYRLALKNAKTVFFENEADMALFRSLQICTEKNGTLLNGAGVNLSHFSLQSYPKAGRTHFLFIGRIMKEKGVEELLTAIQRLKRDGEDCVLDLVGPYEDDYRDVIETYTKEGFVSYHGPQKDVRPFIRDAHCFVLPSWHEGMANTNLECAASGRPIITSDIPGCREALIPHVSGLLCEKRNADSLYRCMKRFLSMSHTQREAMGAMGRQHMEAVFDKEKVVDTTLKALFSQTFYTGAKEGHDMPQELISVIMGVYNCENTVGLAIDSILAQTYENWEFIICDDASDDRTFAIVSEYKKRYPEKFILLRNGRNMGLNHTLNRCLSMAKGPYIARMDGDDLSMKDRLLFEYSALTHDPSLSVVSTAMEYFDEGGTWGICSMKEEPKAADLVRGTVFCHAACMMRKSDVEAVGGYSVSPWLLRVEDWHLWVKLYASGKKGKNINVPYYRMRDDRNAYKRRKYRYRINEAIVIWQAVFKLKLPVWHLVWLFRPLIVGLLPERLYRKLHKKRVNGHEGGQR